MAKRTVEESSLILVADSIRAKAGKSDKLEFPFGYKSAIDSISKSEIKNQDITIKENGTYTADDGYTGFGSVNVEVEGSGGDIPDASTAEFGRVKVAEPAPSGKAYYNGVLLPEIPADVLAQYPYAWIRKNTTSGYYDLFLSPVPFYTVNSDSMSGSGTTKQFYRVAIATAETATEWENNGTSDKDIAYDASRSVLWSNHDIPNGSATATDIYFKGSEPIKEVISGYGDYVDGEDKYAVAIEALNEIAHRIQLHNSSYDLVTGAEIFDFLSRSVFVGKGYANSTLEIDFESSASGSLS